MNTSKSIANLLLSLEGQVCAKAHVALDGAIDVCFGKCPSDDNSKLERPRFEYELGSYYKNWKVISKDGQLDPNEIDVDFVALTGLVAAKLEGQIISSVGYDEKTNEVGVEFRNHTKLSFVSKVEVKDEIFHVRTATFTYVELHTEHGWRSGDSRLPWPQED